MPPCQGGCREFEPRLPLHKDQPKSWSLFIAVYLMWKDREMKKNTTVFFAILLLGIVVRLLFIDKPTGFWHNEMVMYNQTIAGGPIDIIKAAVDADVHFPLYQIFLSFWIKIFGNGDITIRLFSVLAGVLNIIAAYFTGKEIKDNKTGNVFAFLTAINATLIFYSQEVKFYIMLSLLVTLSLFFIIRILKNDKKLDYFGYILINTAIIYTFTIGVLYVFAQGLIVLAYILIKKKKQKIRFILSNVLLIALILPFITYILTHMAKYEGASWIFTSNIFTTFVLIQNFFTPCLMAVYNNPKTYIPTIGISQIIFLYIPIAIAFFSMFKAVKENKNNYFILALPLLFLLFETLLCMNSGLRMLTRYTIMAISPFLLLISLGLTNLKSKMLNIIIGYLLAVNLFYLLASPQSAVRGYRDLGQKPTAIVLTDNKISNNDTIILALRKNDFDKYLDFDGRKFSLLQDFVHEPYALSPKYPNKYEGYKKYVMDYKTLNKDFENDFVKRVLAPMKRHDRVFYIWDENYNSYPVTSEEEYSKLPIMTSSLSKMNADAFMLCDKYLKIQNAVKLKYYKIFIFEK